MLLPTLCTNGWQADCRHPGGEESEEDGRGRTVGWAELAILSIPIGSHNKNSLFDWLDCVSFNRSIREAVVDVGRQAD